MGDGKRDFKILIRKKTEALMKVEENYGQWSEDILLDAQKTVKPFDSTT